MDSQTIVDGVHRLPANGIKIIIIGGGVGGLGAALECWRKGFEVVVLEQVEKLSPLGDFFTITPSALTTLKEYPTMYADYHKNVYDCTIHVYTPSGLRVKSTIPEWKRPGVVSSAPDVDVSFLKRRPEYAKMQLDQAERLGIPVHFGVKVTSVHEESDRVVVTTANGQKIEGEICINSGGIGATVEGFATGECPAVQDSGYAVARVAFPRDTIKPDTAASTLLTNVENEPQFRTYVADDVHLILFLTKDYVAWCFTHPSLNTSKESWHNLQDADVMIEQIKASSKDWDPAVFDFISQTPTQVVDWKLRWRDGAKQWTSDRGRLVLLGDAAHAFFPTAGNGAVQALEDTVSLAECLRLGAKKGDIPWATKVHNELRFQRVSILQQTGFLNREELHNVNVDTLQKDPDNTDVGFFKIGRWMWGHNPEEYARENYDACLARIRAGETFENTNLPPGHVYRDWSLESEYGRMRDGVRSGLKENGYWGL